MDMKRCVYLVCLIILVIFISGCRAISRQVALDKEEVKEKVKEDIKEDVKEVVKVYEKDGNIVTEVVKEVSTEVTTKDGTTTKQVDKITTKHTTNNIVKEQTIDTNVSKETVVVKEQVKEVKTERTNIEKEEYKVVPNIIIYLLIGIVSAVLIMRYNNFKPIKWLKGLWKKE